MNARASSLLTPLTSNVLLSKTRYIKLKLRMKKLDKNQKRATALCYMYDHISKII